MPKKVTQFLVPVIFVFVCIISCKQKTPAHVLYNKEFNWSITIPEGFDTVSKTEWNQIKNRGAEMIEKTFEQKVERDNNKSIFVFRQDKMHYFEANQQDFDSTIDGSYQESVKNVANVMYETFSSQMPKTKIDTTLFKETVSGIDFYVTKYQIALSENASVKMYMYNSLFGTKDFSTNITYVNDATGKIMLDAWRNSIFKK